jgi:RNA polymerase sigma-70 factor (ECF subfamily)
VRALSDGGGEFHAARKPVVGRAKVARYCVNISRRGAARSAIRMLNGLPALVSTVGPIVVVTRIELDADGRIVALHSVLATQKLSAIAAPA